MPKSRFAGNLGIVSLAKFNNSINCSTTFYTPKTNHTFDGHWTCISVVSNDSTTVSSRLDRFDGTFCIVRQARCVAAIAKADGTNTLARGTSSGLPVTRPSIETWATA